MIKITKNMNEVLCILFREKNQNFNDIARKTGISVMGVSKIIKKLKENNIVNVTKIGRSSVVSLNITQDNLEIFALAEKYKFDKFVEKYPKLKPFLIRLKEKTNAGSILIFGSYTSDEASFESDLDLLFINFAKTVIKTINESSVLINVDISPIFITKKDFIKQVKNKHRLYTEIINGKRVLVTGEYNFWKMMLAVL